MNEKNVDTDAKTDVITNTIKSFSIIFIEAKSNSFKSVLYFLKVCVH